MEDYDLHWQLANVLCNHYRSHNFPKEYSLDYLHRLLKVMYEGLQNELVKTLSWRGNNLEAGSCQLALERLIKDNKIQALTSPVEWVRKLAEEILE